VTTKVQKSVVVDVPLSTVYNQWTQFEEFPRFMSGVESVTQLADDRLEWVAEIAGVRRQWIAKILEQVPDRKVAWAAVEGATNAGAVTFDEAGPEQTAVHLELEYEPEGFVETVGDRFNIVERQAAGDLERFKEFVELHPRASGAWRGSISKGATVHAPGIKDAASSYGDSGKVGDPGWEPVPEGVRVDESSLLEPPEGEDVDRPDLIGTIDVGSPPERGDRGLNATDAASGFGDPELEEEPGVVRGNDSRA
jgi:ribosome-associated toxin RatA of RatAB toxin-antitoxin module